MPSGKKLLEKIGQNMNTRVLALIFIVGIVLLLFPTQKKEEKENDKTDTFSVYQAETEKRLSQILSKVKNVGTAEVMITFYNEGQTFFAENTEEQKNGEKQDFSASHVLKNDGSGKSSPLVEKKNAPEVSGVLVVATGANDPAVKENIINAVRAVLGVKTHRIEVLAKK